MNNVEKNQKEQEYFLKLLDKAETLIDISEVCIKINAKLERRRYMEELRRIGVIK